MYKIHNIMLSKHLLKKLLTKQVRFLNLLLGTFVHFLVKQSLGTNHSHLLTPHLLDEV